MKRLILPASLLLCVSLSACKSIPLFAPQAPAPVTAAPLAKVELQTVEFTTGVSSVTVEKLAQKNNCSGGKGAGLLTAQGPVEIYRMRCDEGGAFMARCELRQCQPMAAGK